MTNLIRVLPLLAASLLPATASAHAMPALAQPAATAASAGLVYVTSPWGFTDLYCVRHGWNCLRCSGTGFSFRYFWPGC